MVSSTQYHWNPWLKSILKNVQQGSVDLRNCRHLEDFLEFRSVSYRPKNEDKYSDVCKAMLDELH